MGKDRKHEEKFLIRDLRAKNIWTKPELFLDKTSQAKYEETGTVDKETNQQAKRESYTCYCSETQGTLHGRSGSCESRCKRSSD